MDSGVRPHRSVRTARCGASTPHGGCDCAGGPGGARTSAPRSRNERAAVWCVHGGVRGCMRLRRRLPAAGMSAPRCGASTAAATALATGHVPTRAGRNRMRVRCARVHATAMSAPRSRNEACRLPRAVAAASGWLEWGGWRRPAGARAAAGPPGPRMPPAPAPGLDGTGARDSARDSAPWRSSVSVAGRRRPVAGSSTSAGSSARR
jgi:hypothetical protein